MKLVRSIFCGVVVLCAMCMFPGCMHYTKGTGTKLPFKKIYVAPVKNDAYAPQAQALLTKKIRTKLANYPGIELTSAPTDGAVLDIKIVSFSEPTDTTGDFDTFREDSVVMSMTVKVSLTNLDGDKIFENAEFSENAEEYIASSNINVRYQMMPNLLEKLATKICDAISTVW